MKKYLSVILVLLCTLTSCSFPTKPDPIHQEIDRIDNAIDEVFDGAYKKQRETEISDYHYASKNSTMVYYICQTTFYAADPTLITGVDTDAVLAIFPVEDARLEKEFEICGHPAVIYQLEEQAYLCCTPEPEYTLVLAYEPEFLSEEEAVKTIRGVFEPVE